MMISHIINFFAPPIYQSFERSQKAKVLHATLLVTAAACLVLGIQNIPGESNLDLVLFGASGLCLVGVWLNKRGSYLLIASIGSVSFLVLITFSLIDGYGIMDAGMLAYPIVIMFISFFFDKRVTIPTVLISIISVILVYQLNPDPQAKTLPFSPQTQMVVLVVLITGAGLILWTIMGNWERNLENLRETYDLTLAGWAKALEYRDRETEGHSQRVTSLCTDLANSFGFSPGEVENIQRGALLHDIGKMAIPDTVFLKSGVLSDEEWDIIKKHPDNAKELIEQIPFLMPALEIPYCHHERWNGSGYPQGLSGENIPLSARIFSVIDVWDALLSDRPYRPAWSEEKTRTYIKENSGILFDPEVVNAFFELIDNPGQ